MCFNVTDKLELDDFDSDGPHSVTVFQWFEFY